MAISRLSPYKSWTRRWKKWRRISYKHSITQMRTSCNFIISAMVSQLTIRQLSILFLQATRVQSDTRPHQWQLLAVISRYKQLSSPTSNTVCLVTTDTLYADATRESAFLAKTYFRVGEKRGALSNRLKNFCNIAPGMSLFKHVILLNSTGSDNFLRELRVQTNLYSLFMVFRRASDKRLTNHSLLSETLRREESLYLVFLYIYLTGQLLSRLSARF